MKRLTEKVFGFVQLKACGNDFCKETCAEHDEEKSCKNCPIQRAFEKLAEYEDLEEQGLLLRLPCKVGDTVHELDIFLERNPLIIEMEVTDIIIRDDDIYFELVDLHDDNYTNSVLITEFGRTVFLTQAEAEQKLKEMESD